MSISLHPRAPGALAGNRTRPFLAPLTEDDLRARYAAFPLPTRVFWLRIGSVLGGLFAVLFALLVALAF
ncbi:hypothetical protein BH23BAC4_BH23BAC4_16560 [soil metagenome]